MMISMQVACGCAESPQPMEQDNIWDGESEGGWTEGRRYTWTCMTCGNVICVNLNILEEEE